jgi:hypothetical protein
MPLAEIAAVAGILGNATNIIDKIFSRFFERKTGQAPPQGHLPENSSIIVNKPGEEALVITSHGNEQQKVTYDQLAQKLSAADLQYIKTRERVRTCSIGNGKVDIWQFH